MAECLVNKRTDSVQFDYSSTQLIAINRITAIAPLDDDEKIAW